MSFGIPYINDAFTLLENGFNLVGYLPRHHFLNLHAFSVRWRCHCGLGQVIVGLALAALGYLAHYALPMLARTSYLSLPLQAVSLGLLYANHGAFNMIRSCVERGNIPGLTLVYDFYGKKVLPALSSRCDFLRHLFERIKALLNRICFVTIFPPQFAAV